jgi:surface protein
LCGGQWQSLSSDSYLTATGRLGCCPAGSFMSNPTQHPFDAGTSCSVCPSDQQGTVTENDETSCCAAFPVTAGTCTACTSDLASGCTAVSCDFGYDNTDGDATNGCEVCAPVTDGTCTACTSALASDCTAVSCDVGYNSLDDDATNGCEVSCAPVTAGTCTACTSALVGACTAVKCIADRRSMDNDANNGCEAFATLPNGDGETAVHAGTLRRVVSDWIDGGASKSTVVEKYGPIEDWDVSEVTNMGYVFYNFRTFNADLSKWNTGAVTTMNAMFIMASAFNSDVSNWNTEAVTDMEGMFSLAYAFNSDVSNWNTSAVTTMKNMFYYAWAFNSDVSNWNTGAVTSMQNMFYDSGFTRTLCGGAWGSLTGSISAFYNLGSSTARLGCCSPGTYMAQPNLHPFSEATACAACPSASYGSAVEDDITSCICVAGYWLNEGVCATCATIGGAATVTCTTGNDQVAATCVAGYWLDEGVCTACAFGFVSIEGSSACVDLSQQMDASELRAVFTAMKQC